MAAYTSYEVRHGRLRNPMALWKTLPRPLSDFVSSREHPEPETVLEVSAVREPHRKFTKWWHYFDAYDDHLGRLAEMSRTGQLARPLRILEIGVWHGGSLDLWRSYFGSEAIIFGIDIDPRCAELDSEAGSVRIGSQVDAEFLDRVVWEMGQEIDIIIDDGSHRSDR